MRSRPSCFLCIPIAPKFWIHIDQSLMRSESLESSPFPKPHLWTALQLSFQGTLDSNYKTIHAVSFPWLLVSYTIWLTILWSNLECFLRITHLAQDSRWRKGKTWAAAGDLVQIGREHALWRDERQLAHLHEVSKKDRAKTSLTEGDTVVYLRCPHS